LKVIVGAVFGVSTFGAPLPPLFPPPPPQPASKDIVSSAAAAALKSFPFRFIKRFRLLYFL
jgi:hypothetical protein